MGRAGLSEARCVAIVSGQRSPTTKAYIRDDADQDSLAVKTFSCNPAGAVPFDGDPHGISVIRLASAFAVPNVVLSTDRIRGLALRRAAPASCRREHASAAHDLPPLGGLALHAPSDPPRRR